MRAVDLRALRNLEQERHRVELRLQRLRTAGRRLDANAKFRLGSLAVLVGWDALDAVALDVRLGAVAALLEDAGGHRALHERGGAHFAARARQREDRPKVVTPLDADARRALAHRRIASGGLFVRHDLGRVPRAVLLGALLEVDALVGDGTSPHRNGPEATPIEGRTA